MRFLADESCDFAVVRALRGRGFDVIAISETCPGAEDQRVIGLARKEGQVLLTEDKDFGRFNSHFVSGSWQRESRGAEIA